MDYATFNSRLPVPRETFDKLSNYVELLLKWQPRINLISSKDIDVVWERHILDACQFSLCNVPRETTLLDLGSGAGLPGLILSVLGFSNVTLVESDSRKSVFLQEAARVLGLPVTICNQRIETLPPRKWAMISARGCASLSRLFELSYPLMSDGAICLFAKGKNYANEIEHSLIDWFFEYHAIPSITDPHSVLLSISNLTMRAK